MSLALDTDAAARSEAAVASPQWLIELQFTTGTLRLTTWPLDIPVGADTYMGIGNDLLAVSDLSESEDASRDRLTLTLNIVNSAMLTAALGPASTYRGRRAVLSLQFLDEDYQPDGAPAERWRGYMDKVQILREPAPQLRQSGSKGRIELQLVRAGQARSRNATGLRLTHAQQQQEYPGDMGLEYVQSLIEKPEPWLSKRFQEI